MDSSWNPLMPRVQSVAWEEIRTRIGKLASGLEWGKWLEETFRLLDGMGKYNPVPRLFLSGCDVPAVFEKLYLYCSPKKSVVENSKERFGLFGRQAQTTARRARRLAQDINGINSHPSLSTAISAADFHHLAQLPKLLKEYASILEGPLLRVTSRVGSQRSLAKTYLLVYLSCHIRQVVGNGHQANSDLAALVQAGYKALGIDKDVSRESIADLCSRYRQEHPSSYASVESAALRLDPGRCSADARAFLDRLLPPTEPESPKKMNRAK